jgi:hypothetical protein
MSEAWIVDGIEEGWARVEAPDGQFVIWPSAWLPEQVVEGAVLRVEPSGGGLERQVRITVDEAATEQRRAALGGWRDKLPRGPSGDLDL